MGTATKKNLAGIPKTKKKPFKRVMVDKKPLKWDIPELKRIFSDKEDDLLLDTYNVYNNGKQLDYIVKYYTPGNGESKLVLCASNELHWSDHIRGQELMTLHDTGNGVVLSSTDSEFDYKSPVVIMDYSQAEYIRILFHMKRAIIDTSEMYSFQVFKNQKITEL